MRRVKWRDEVHKLPACRRRCSALRGQAGALCDCNFQRAVATRGVLQNAGLHLLADVGVVVRHAQHHLRRALGHPEVRVLDLFCSNASPLAGTQPRDSALVDGVEGRVRTCSTRSRPTWWRCRGTSGVGRRRWARCPPARRRARHRRGCPPRTSRAAAPGWSCRRRAC